MGHKLAVVLAAITTLISCHPAVRKDPVSVVYTGDPSRAKQLVGGFFAIEAKSWRWTGRKFVVTLLPPPGSEQKGAKLRLHFAIPESQIAKIGPMTLSADVDDYSLAPETYSKGGEYFYTRDIPANLLRTNLIPVIFTFDKASPPTSSDERELGAVVSLIALNTN
jgi:hypothetical protein